MANKTTKEQRLTPRACPWCERHMDREFLEERQRIKAERVSANAKAMTPEVVAQMLRLRAQGLTYAQVGKAFGVHADTVRNRLGERLF